MTGMPRFAKHPLLLWGGIVCLVLTLAGLGTQRQMYPLQSGSGIYSPADWKSPDTRRIRVSTYNIQKAVGTDGKRDLQKILGVVSDDDIVGLQEVLGSTWTNWIDQAETLARAMGAGWLYAPSQTRYFREYYGNALISRFPVESWRIIPLVWSNELGNTTKSLKHRNRIEARIVIDEIPVQVIVTHLDRGTIRPVQLLEVLGEFERHQHVILLADMNTDPQDSTMRQWLTANPGVDVSEDITNKVDWILVKGFRTVDYGTAPSGPSDHPYYWAELELVD